jgi:hypothetical protein
MLSSNNAYQSYHDFIGDGEWRLLNGKSWYIANRWGCNVGSGGMDRRIARAAGREDQIRTSIVDKLLLSC